jgi:hypothetical protein
VTLPNGIVTVYGYDNASQLTALTYTLGQTPGGDPFLWTVDLSGFVLRSSCSSEKKMIDVDAVGISRSLRDFQTPVGAFCASTGVAASTSSSTSRKVSMA